MRHAACLTVGCPYLLELAVLAHIRRWAISVATMLLIFSAQGSPVVAQQTPLCVTGCLGTYIVNVTPDLWTANAVAGVSTTLTFTVSNDGTASDQYALVCHTVGSETCGTVSPSNLSLAAGAYSDVQVTFTPGSAGTSGTLRLIATGSGEPVAKDSGSFTVTNVSPLTPAATLVNQNGTNVDRSLCLTLGAGEEAALGCGDLVVTHGLPSYATMGRERSLTLLYNSVQAVPQPLLAFDVSVPARMATAPSVYVEFRLGAANTLRASATWTGWAAVNYAVPQVRQLALSFVDTTDATGVYPFSLLVQYQYSSGPKPYTLTGNLIIVNRSQSQYGRGWSLIGVQQLYFNQPVGASNGSILLVGGDGSAKLYGPVGTNRWVAPLGAYRDTLYYNPSDTTYTDTLRHKVVITFDASGRHIRTATRVGQKTKFHWNTSTGLLDTISVPPAGASGISYLIAYDGNGKLDKITDPTSRVLDATVTSNRLTSLLDPDMYSTGFGYDGAGRMVARTSRRGFTTRFAYAHGLRLTSDSVRIDTAGASSPAYAITTFQPWDEMGLAIGPTNQSAVDTSLVYTIIDGPRTDVVDVRKVRVDSFGAPVRVINPLGFTTTILRGSAAVPALITQVTTPDGRIVKLSWDALGNLTQTRDSTSHLGSAGLQTRVTRLTYSADSTRFSPDSVIDSTETGTVVTRYVYNRWGLLRDAILPNGHVTHFDYLTGVADSGLVRAVTELAVPAWDTTTRTNLVLDRRRSFGINSLGNVVSDTSPMGHVTTYTRDGSQRVTHVYDPEGHHAERVYDALNRVVQLIRHVEFVDPGYTQPLVTSFHYAIDVVDSIADPRKVPRAYRYDAAGRRTKEIDDYGHADVLYYDPAGLVDSVRTRMDTVGRSQVIRNTYDAAGELTKTAWPPLAPTLKDSILFTYDVAGRLLTATSSTRRTSRTYFALGAVKSEVQSDAVGGSPNTLTYSYDRLGRRLFYLNGTPGSSVYSDSIFYHYVPATGELQTVGVRWRQVASHAPPVAIDSVRFHFDPLGRRDQVTYVWRGIVLHLAYDGDGRLRLACAKQNPLPGGDHVFNFTIYSATADSDGLVRRTTYDTLGLTTFGCGTQGLALGPSKASYDSRHQLVLQVAGNDSLIYGYDGSGNRTRAKDVSLYNLMVLANHVEQMDSGHNRLHMWKDSVPNIGYPMDSVHINYEASGAEGFTQPWLGGHSQCGPENRQYAYDALGRTSGTLDMNVCSWVDNTTQCVYEPLGRLYRPCENAATPLAYDGHNVVRTGSDQATSAFTIVHGPGVDDPLIGFTPSGQSTLPFYFYYLTDGQGRQLAVGDTNSCDLKQTSCSPNGSNTYGAPQFGGMYAGGTTNAYGFGAARDSNDQAPDLSFFRNRFYDQKTGRWTQEDPMGIAGGLNLYAYVGNDPVSYTDPFGLTTSPKCDEIKTHIKNLIDMLLREINNWETKWFEKISPRTGRPYDHVGTIKRYQRDLGNRKKEYFDTCDDKDDDDFNNMSGLLTGAMVTSLLNYDPGEPKPLDSNQSNRVPGADVAPTPQQIRNLTVAAVLAAIANAIGSALESIESTAQQIPVIP